ncbi:MAG: flagellar biosynthetic protein FliR [Bacillota bacterium]
MNIETFFGFTFTQILLGFARTSGLVAAAPVFQSRFLPVPVKILFSFALALVVAPFIRSSMDLTRFNFWMAVFTIIQEVLVGLIIGFVVNLTLFALQLAGYYFDVSMGFGVVNILDPNTGTEMPLLGQFNYILALLIFLAINGHHTLIMSLIQSYEVVKPGMLFLKKEAAGVFVEAFAKMFYLGFKIGIPILGTIFLVDVALGVIAKLIPQINVFMIGFPVKIILGLLVLILFLPIYVFLVEVAFAKSGETFGILRLMLKQLHQ